MPQRDDRRLSRPEGRRAGETAMSERESMPYDVVIVGAGPAGLGAAIRLKQMAADAGSERVLAPRCGLSWCNRPRTLRLELTSARAF